MVVLMTVYLALMFGCGATERAKPYTDYKLVKISSQSPEKVEKILRSLNHIDDLQRNHLDNSAVVIVTRDDMDRVQEAVSMEGGVVNVLENNLQTLVDEEYRHLDLRRRRRRDVSMEGLLKEFLDLGEIYDFQERVMSCNSQATVRKRTIGNSVSNNPINVLQISKAGPSKNKKTIFIEAGVHAREWLSPATANYIIYQLACNRTNNDLLDLFDWEVIPVMNPDGYQYTHVSGHRYWRKNRQANEGSDCIGTDINRNFEVGFGTDGDSNDTCSNKYGGPYSYSTPESKALRDYVLGISDDIVSYLSLHTFGQYILMPWGYKDDIPLNFDQLIYLARKAESAMGLPFKIGPAYSTIYPAGGVSQDFATDVAGIDRSFTWELMPGKEETDDKHGFSPDESDVSVDTPIVWRGIRAYVEAVAEQTGVVTGDVRGTVRDDPYADLSGSIGIKTTAESVVSTGHSDFLKDSALSRWYSVIREVLESKYSF